MNRILASLALLAFLAVGAQAQLLPGTDYIKNTGHNLGTHAGGEICKPCHTPHNAMYSDASDRLWNHALTNATYEFPNGTGKTATADLDRVSRLCLSCHDGTVAIDSFGEMGVGAGTGTMFMTNQNKLGTDLSNDHPIGSAAIMDPNYSRNGVNYAWKPITINASNTSATVGAAKLRLQKMSVPDAANPGTNKDVWVVGCRTCHTAHGAGYPSLLNTSNNQSAICLSCHYK